MNKHEEREKVTAKIRAVSEHYGKPLNTWTSKGYFLEMGTYTGDYDWQPGEYHVGVKETPNGAFNLHVLVPYTDISRLRALYPVFSTFEGMTGDEVCGIDIVGIIEDDRAKTKKHLAELYEKYGKPQI